MYETAVAFIQKRFPTGWGGAGSCTRRRAAFTSVALESANAGVLLCIETGAMCEAHKYNERVTHCLCVVRDDENTRSRCSRRAASVRRGCATGARTSASA